MNKILKFTLIGFGSIFALVIAIIAFVAATFNPNDYKPKVQQLVLEKLDRKLKIDGDIKLTFYPSLGADLGKLSLSERGAEQEFSAIDSARVSLQLMPLLSRELVVSQVEVNGLRAHMVKHKDGSSNIDDLLGKHEAAPKMPAGTGGGAPAQKPLQFDIDHVLIDNVSLSYTDEGTGAKYEIGKLKLKTGKIAPGQPSEIELAAQGVTASQAKAKLDVGLKTKLDFDVAGKHFKLDALELALKGEAAGLNPLALTLTGVIEGDTKTLKSNEIVLDVEAKQGERAIKARLSAPLAADLETQKFDLAKLVVGASVSNTAAPGVTLNLSGVAHIDLPKETASLDFSTRFGDSNIKGRAGLTHFSPPAYSFDVNIDKLDVDHFLGTKPTAAAADAGKTESAKPEQPIDVSALKTLSAHGSLKVGAFKVMNLNMQNLLVDLKAGGGRLDLNPLSASLYQGAVNGSVSVVAAAVPQVAVKQNLSSISIGPLLKDLINKDILEGKGSVAVDITGQGATVSAIKRALDGSASINLTDGAMKGINIGAAIRNAREKLASFKGEPQTQAANESDKTDFSELKASFVVKNGIAHNSDLSLKSPLLRLGGEGDINIGAGSIDYLAKGTLVATAAGQGGKSISELKGITVPVRITGPFTALSYKLDFNALISGLAQQKIGDELKTKVQDKLKDQLKDQLKGLFKR